LKWATGYELERFHVLTATSIKITVLLDVAPFGVVEIDRSFGGDFCLHHQVGVSYTRGNPLASCCGPSNEHFFGRNRLSHFSVTFSRTFGYRASVSS
jgi:hypothetical protein